MKKEYLANLNVGSVLLHNLHWNVSGINFKAVHEYLEEIYDDFFEKFDEVAERMKMDGEFPPATTKKYLELATFEELPDDKVWTGKEAIEEAKKLLEEMRRIATEIRAKADEADDFNWVGMMEDHIASYDVRIWFMSEMLK